MSAKARVYLLLAVSGLFAVTMGYLIAQELSYKNQHHRTKTITIVESRPIGGG